MTTLRLLLRPRLPEPAIPRVLSVDDFALRRGRHYATLLIDAVTHQRIDVLADRKAATLTAWLGSIPVSRSSAGTDRPLTPKPSTLPTPPRSGSDRWHLRHNLAAAVDKTVIAHASCWNSLPHNTSGVAAQRTRRRFAAVHELTDVGVGLLETTRRLGWSLNTVKRYARAESVEQLLRPPRYGRCLVDPYRDLVRRRLSEQVPVTRILDEIRAAGYTRSANLLVRYFQQGRADAPGPVPSPRKPDLVDHVPTLRSGHRPTPTHRTLDRLLPQMTAMARQVHAFATNLTYRRGIDLPDWIETTRSLQLPGFGQFLDSLVKAQPAVTAGLTLPYSNRPIEGANTKVKLLKTPDARPCRVPPATPPDPAQLTITTKPAQEPNV